MQELQPVNGAAEIPSIFYAHVLSGSASLSHPVRFWSLVHMILQQALGHLDSRRMGLALHLVCCMAPNDEGNIRSLRTSIGLGTPPWDVGMEVRPCLLGSESLAGRAVSSQRLMVIDGSVEKDLVIVQGQARDIYAAACPIERAHAIAGCLLIYSIHVGYFSQAKLALIKCYTDLLALAFEPDEFHDAQQFDLHIMPPLEKQAQSFASFRSRVADVLTASMQCEQLMDVMQAELQVWSQFEEEFCCKTMLKNSSERA